MTTKMTVSFAKGKKSETSIHHNNRSIEKDFDFENKGHRHINPALTHMNEVLVHDNIRDVYEQEFGEAVKKYNEKQRRKDRRIADYYDKIKHSKSMRTQYEFIAQIGNKNDWDKYSRHSEQWGEGKKMLEQYYEGFSKRNPNLRVYNASIHMDEEGSPHLHLNVVPIARGYKQGVKVRPSFDKALKEQGIDSDPQDSRSLFRNFQKQEQQALADIARSRGIERVAGITNKLRDVHEYKEAQKLIEETRDQKLNHISKEVMEKRMELSRVSSDVKAETRKRDQLRRENERLRKEQEAQKKQEELRKAVIEKQDREIAEKKKLLEKLEEKAKAFRDRAKQLAKSVATGIHKVFDKQDPQKHELLREIGASDAKEQLNNGVDYFDLDASGWEDAGFDDAEAESFEEGMDQANDNFEAEKDGKQQENTAKPVSNKRKLSLEEQYKQYLDSGMDR